MTKLDFFEINMYEIVIRPEIKTILNNCYV